METRLAKLQAAVAAYPARYPEQKYGVGQALRTGRIIGNKTHLEVVPPESGTYFDCGISSLCIYQELKDQGFNPVLLSLQLPLLTANGTEKDSKIEHVVVEVSLGDQQALIGVTPFDQVLGLTPLRLFANAPHADNLKKLRGMYFGASAINEHRYHFGELKYFLGVAREDEHSFYLAEGGFDKGWFFWTFTLKVCLLRGLPDKMAFQYLGSISFRFHFPRLANQVLFDQLFSRGKYQLGRYNTQEFDCYKALVLADNAWQGLARAVEHLLG